MPYHVNPDTGRANICRATKKACPLGGAEVHFATGGEAREHFERTMAGQTVSSGVKKDSNFPAPTPYRLQLTDATYHVDYEYDDYDCADPYYCSESNDYCRDRQYTGLRVENVTAEEVYGYAATRIGAREVPEDLKLILDQSMDQWRDGYEWAATSEPDYYGDRAVIEAPPALDRTIEAWFYDQDGAVDRDEILPYLRGLGVDTKGKTPVEAVKTFLAEQNGGTLSAQVQAAKGVSLNTLSLKSFDFSEKRYAGTAPVAPEPVAASGASKEIAGILVETAVIQQGWRQPARLGPTKLIDGYGRVRHYNDATNRRQVSFIVLRKEKQD